MAKIISLSGRYDDLRENDVRTIHALILSHSLQELFRYCTPRSKEELTKATLEWNYLFNDDYESGLPFETLLDARGIDIDWARRLILRVFNRARTRGKRRLGFNMVGAALKRLGIGDYVLSNSTQKKTAA